MRRSAFVHAAPLVPLIAQSEDGLLPEDPSGRVVFVVVGVAIVALYLLLRSTRRRTEAAYWDRRRHEQAQRDADPDMRSDDDR